MRNGMTLEFKVTQQTITRLDSNVVYENSNNYLFAHFIFSDDWKGATKVVKFRDAFTDAYVDVTLGRDNKCTIPSITTLYPVTFLTIVGTKENQIITTNDIAIDVFKSGENFDVPHPVTHDGNQLKTYANEDIFPNTLIEVTYDELATLKEEHKLVLGAKYRITDYVTKVNGTINNVEGLARSTEHPFDIVVTATSTDRLSENARAIPHDGDTYFANCDLSAWQLWYCFANDSTRFEFADTINGKGVIYRMIDEFDNDIPYDFKNVQFKRFKITGTTDARQEGLIGKYLGFTGSYAVTFDTNDFKWYYTLTDDTQEESNDLSILSVYDHSYANCRYAKQVAIGEYLADEPNYRYRQALNDIVLASPSIIVDIKMREGSTKNTIIGNKDLTYNYFGAMCRRNIMYGEITHNKSDECMESNTIGNGTRDFEAFHWNRVGRHFARNIVISAQANNFATGSVSDNKFPNLLWACDFNSWVQQNDFSGLDKAQGIKLHKVTLCTLSGSAAWMYCDFLALESCNINIDNFCGSKVDFLQKVTLTKNSGDTVNLINIDISTIIGSPTTINLSDLLSYSLSGTRCHKTLDCIKTNNGGGNRFEYTCEYVEDGAKSILGAYSEDNGVTWRPIKNYECYRHNLRFTFSYESEDPETGEITEKVAGTLDAWAVLGTNNTITIDNYEDYASDIVIPVQLVDWRTDWEIFDHEIIGGVVYYDDFILTLITNGELTFRYSSDSSVYVTDVSDYR